MIPEYCSQGCPLIPSKQNPVRYDLSMEQGAQKVDHLRSQSVRKEDEHMAALEEKVRALQFKNRPDKRSNNVHVQDQQMQMESI